MQIKKKPKKKLQSYLGKVTILKLEFKQRIPPSLAPIANSVVFAAAAASPPASPTVARDNCSDVLRRAASADADMRWNAFASSSLSGTGGGIADATAFGAGGRFAIFPRSDTPPLFAAAALFFQMCFVPIFLKEVRDPTQKSDSLHLSWHLYP